VRCSACAKGKKDADKLTIKDMSQQLQVIVN
jgi:hypothetical protein